MIPKYRFFVNIDDDTRQVYPLYGDKASLVYTLEKEQQLYRTSLEGEFKFIKDDFDFILSKPFDSDINITIERSVDFGKTYSEYFQGKFTRTDCTINETDKILKTSITPIDGYENIIGGLDKEFNLIELAPAMQSLYLYKRPAIQIYITGENVLTTFVGGTYFEQEVTTVDDNAKLAEYGFSRQAYIKEATIEGSSDYSGVYVCKTEAGPNMTRHEFFKKINDTRYQLEFYIREQFSDVPWEGDLDGTKYYFKVAQLIDTQTGKVLYKREYDTSKEFFKPNTRYSIISSANESDWLYFSYVAAPVYARLLLDVDTYRDAPTQELMPDDIAPNNINYKRYARLDNNFLISNIAVSAILSDEPTEWGLYQPGKYYNKPYSIYTKQFYPIGRSSWLNTSIWYSPGGLDELIEYGNRKKYALRHAYTLAGCIKVLLAKVAPELTFEESPLYSRFFYEQNNPISNDTFRLFITPVTNITKGEYDQPAQKAIITLRNIFDMLKACYKCYWFVDRGRLRIEHVSFFRNGLNYLALADSGIDVSNIIEPKTQLPWTTSANSYRFDKLNIPEYLQFKWADSVSKPFDGYPIEVHSNYVEKGNVEEVNVQKFSSDVDLMLLNPSSFSGDNFAILSAKLNAGSYELPFLNTTVEGYEYNLQNGLLSFVDLQPKYYTKDLPANKVTINGQEYIADKRDIKRSKLQEIKFPVGLSLLNPMQLIKTKIGEGLADKITINLHSQIAQATLRYDNE